MKASTICRNIFSVLFIIALMVVSASAQDTAYRRVQLAYGISLEIPSHWEVLSQDDKQNLAAGSEAISGNAGYTENYEKKERLLAVSAKPLGAKIRVNVTTPTKLTQPDIAALSTATEAELSQLRTELSSGFDPMFKEMEASFGIKSEMQTPRIERIGNKWALAVVYTRTDPRDASQWQVTIYEVPISNKLIEFTLSHRQSDAIIWKPILEYVKRSILF